MNMNNLKLKEKHMDMHEVKKVEKREEIKGRNKDNINETI